MEIWIRIRITPRVMLRIRRKTRNGYANCQPTRINMVILVERRARIVRMRRSLRNGYGCPP